MKHEPILHVYQDGDRFFAALPGFVDLQESEIVWLDKLELVLQNAYEKLCIQFRDKDGQQKPPRAKCTPGVRTVETVDQWGRCEVAVKGDSHES